MSNKKGGSRFLRSLSFRKRKKKKSKPLPTTPELTEANVSLHAHSSNSIRVKGSVRRNDENDVKLVSELDDMYCSTSFKSTDYIMNNLPLDLTLDYLETKSIYYKEYCDAVQRTFKKKLLNNSHSFVEGMQKIQDVKLDLLLTNSLCKSARQSLHTSDKSLIHTSFNIISCYQKRKRMQKTVNILYEIRKLFENEKKYHNLLNSNQDICDILQAIKLHQDIIHKIYNKYLNLKCFDIMRKRFADKNKPIIDKLKLKLLYLINNTKAKQFDNKQLIIIFESFHKLNELNHLLNLLLDSFNKILEIKCSKIICNYADNIKNKANYIKKYYSLNSKYNTILHPNTVNNQNKNKYINYRGLCRKLGVNKFMPCFMDICGRIFDILNLYYKIESRLIKYYADNNYKHSNNNSYNIHIIRKELWLLTQNLLGNLLESSQFSSRITIKMEDLLLALHGATIFKIIGESFSGQINKSNKLETSIRSKCTQYLNHFRKTFFESIKTNFDNDRWIVLPVQSNFGLHSIKELRRNNKWKLLGIEDDKKTKKNDNNNEMRSIYQQFLSGDNIFDNLLLTKKQYDDRNKSKPLNIFEVEENNHHINHHQINGNDNGTEPCITSTSMALAKFIGKSLQIMESLDPISYDTFCALRDSFRFYLYHIFIWFGVNIHNFFQIQESEFTNLFNDNGRKKNAKEQQLEKQRKEQIAQQKRAMEFAQKKYPLLTKVINDVNELLMNRKLAPELDDLIKKKFRNKVCKPKKLPMYAKCYMVASVELMLNSAQTMQGVAARFVATETLTFLVQIIKSQHGRLINILNKSSSQQLVPSMNYTREVSSFINECEDVIREFKVYMYRNVPTLLVHLGSLDNNYSIISMIKGTNWNMKSLTTEPNKYVQELINIFANIEKVLASFPTLPKFIYNKLNCEAIIYVEEQLVEAYADCRKCTTEGRALMSLDQSVLKKSYPINKYNHSWEYTTNFIQAYYLPSNDLIKWIEQHPEYSLKVHKSFIRVGRASELLKRKKEKLQFEQLITETWKKAKEKQIKLEKEKKLEEKNKPNLNLFINQPIQQQNKPIKPNINILKPIKPAINQNQNQNDDI